MGVARAGGDDIEGAVAERPREDSLNIEPLVLALLVVGGDPLRRQRLDIVDPQNIADRVRDGHGGTASVTPPRLVLVVNGAAGIANEERCCRKFPTVFGSHTGRKFCAIDAEGAALVVDQASRPEFGDRKEPRALKICGPPARSAANRRHIGIKRQPRKVIAAQEAFGREITVGVEIRAAARRASLQERELFVRLGLLLLCRSALLGAQPMHLRFAVGILQLIPRPLIKLTPTIERPR